jgi:hypothetical protein
VIALVFTLLVAVYILGPDLVARWILGFVAPRKNLVLSRSEEVAHGFLWSIVPLTIAWMLRHVGPYSLAPGSSVDLQTFFSGLYSESYFEQNRQAFFSSAITFIHLNACLAVRLYSVVIAASLAINFLIAKYGVMRNWIASHRRLSWLRVLLSTLILPRVSEWHVILSPMLLPSPDMNIEVDVLTKSDVLYQGALRDKILAQDGSLQSITLGSPKKFEREKFLEARKQNPDCRSEEYWKAIPGSLFVVIASDITNLNIRHLPSSVRRFGQEFSDVADAMKLLQAAVSKIQSENSE